jgi:hypothetical protein
MWSRKSKPLLEKTHKKILETLDLFENCANLRIIDGSPMKVEIDILSDVLHMAEKFIDKIRIKRAHIYWTAETRFYPSLTDTSVIKMQSITFPEEVAKEVMSYLPTVYRWDSLRQKYTDEFLANALNKKSVARIKAIFQGLHGTACDQVAYMKRHKGTSLGVFSVHNPDSRDLLYDALSKWNMARHKPAKIEAIIWLYTALECAHSKTIVKKTVYDEFCARMIRILHMLVIAVKPVPKKPRAKKA